MSETSNRQALKSLKLAQDNSASLSPQKVSLVLEILRHFQTKVAQHHQTYKNFYKFLLSTEGRKDRRDVFLDATTEDWVVVTGVENKSVAMLYTSSIKYDIPFIMQKSMEFNQCCPSVPQLNRVLTHRFIYNHITNSISDKDIKPEDFVLLVEDDVLFVEGFEDKIGAILEYLKQERFSEVDLVLLGRDNPKFVDGSSREPYNHIYQADKSSNNSYEVKFLPQQKELKLLIESFEKWLQVFGKEELKQQTLESKQEVESEQAVESEQEVETKQTAENKQTEESEQAAESKQTVEIKQAENLSSEESQVTVEQETEQQTTEQQTSEEPTTQVNLDPQEATQLNRQITQVIQVFEECFGDKLNDNLLQGLEEFEQIQAAKKLAQSEQKDSENTEEKAEEKLEEKPEEKSEENGSSTGAENSSETSSETAQEEADKTKEESSETTQEKAEKTSETSVEEAEKTSETTDSSDSADSSETTSSSESKYTSQSSSESSEPPQAAKFTFKEKLKYLYYSLFGGAGIIGKTSPRNTPKFAELEQQLNSLAWEQLEACKSCQDLQGGLDKITFYSPRLLTSLSATCFLVRKSALKRIVTQHDKFYWFVDDFQRIFSPLNVLVTDDYFAVRNPEIKVTSLMHYGVIPNEYAIATVKYRVRNTPSDLRVNKILKLFPQITWWNLSEDPLLRARSKQLQAFWKLDKDPNETPLTRKQQREMQKYPKKKPPVEIPEEVLKNIT